MEKKIQRNFLWIALLVLGTIWILARHNRMQPYYTVNGLIFFRFKIKIKKTN